MSRQSSVSLITSALQHEHDAVAGNGLSAISSLMDTIDVDSLSICGSKEGGSFYYVLRRKSCRGAWTYSRDMMPCLCCADEPTVSVDVSKKAQLQAS